MHQAEQNKSLFAEIVTPEGVLHSCESSMVIVPGAHGEFGVLPMHSPVIAMMQPGVATIHTKEGEQTKFFIFQGFAEVTGDRCVLLAEKAVPLKEVTSDLVDQRYRNIQYMIAQQDLTKESPEVKKELLITDAMAQILSS